ncbi:hypothetical protein HYH03_017097 [Edaphochlamys debaryana]|uniref:YEATS domain-containing protein n=1 Tax=Edaphochlamys debaryana TaxID=47281 RepID=A0A836BQY2_9CHLO|nr:hypothetical protein HYH03_017097 [Edaphochlamys debaryana]|eukprot:KAG2484078.1 hypothetical protein HYH03_017097 [Edaphochlamys debaryana]
MYSKLINECGFRQADTHLLIDTPRRSVLAALQRLIGGMGNNDVVLVFFSGHGAERGGTNILCTVDGDTININSDILEPINHRANNAIVVLLLDCCRFNESDPTFKTRSAAGQQVLVQQMAERMQRAADSHTRTFKGKNQFLIGYGCDPGSVSVEKNHEGVFTSSLLKHIGRPRPIQLMALDVRRDVISEQTQRCWFNDSTTEEFSLSWTGGGGGGGHVQPQAAQAVAPPPQQSKVLDLTYGNTCAFEHDSQRWRWSFYITGAAQQYISHVDIELHPTFDPPAFTLHDRPFQTIGYLGWGTFPVEARVHFTDGRQMDLEWTLRFEEGGASRTIRVNLG